MAVILYLVDSAGTGREAEGGLYLLVFLLVVFHICVIIHLVEYNIFVYDCQWKEGEMKEGKERRESRIRKNQVRERTENNGKINSNCPAEKEKHSIHSLILHLHFTSWK